MKPKAVTVRDGAWCVMLCGRKGKVYDVIGDKASRPKGAMAALSLCETHRDEIARTRVVSFDFDLDDA